MVAGIGYDNNIRFQFGETVIAISKNTITCFANFFIIFIQGTKDCEMTEIATIHQIKYQFTMWCKYNTFTLIF
ncbi:hypothetical protein CF113_15220 [Aeromonas veronii]|nr:hypothetical protein CF113_15220 [Aeromonas veronii]